jgi:hypothetical protein
MIRPFTCLSLLMFAGSGMYLYSAKHQVQLLDRDIARLVRTAQENRTRAQMLHAEYDLLGDPDRLRELSTQVLPNLQATAPTQFTTLADLDRRLPPPGPLPAPAADQAAQLVASVTPDRPADHPADKSPEKPPEKLADKPAEKPVERHVERVAEKPPERPILLSQPLPPPPRPRPAPPVAVAMVEPLRAAPPPSILSQRAPPRAVPPAPLAQPVRRPQELAPPVTTTEAIARIARGGPVDASVPVVASALGMARTMMVPNSPIGSAQAQPISTMLPQVRR